MACINLNRSRAGRQDDHPLLCPTLIRIYYRLNAPTIQNTAICMMISMGNWKHRFIIIKLIKSLVRGHIFVTYQTRILHSDPRNSLPFSVGVVCVCVGVIVVQIICVNELIMRTHRRQAITVQPTNHSIRIAFHHRRRLPRTCCSPPK